MQTKTQTIAAVTIAAMTALVSSAARAQSPQDNSTLTSGEPIARTVVTATRTEASAENVGSAVTIITRRDIENSQARTIAEVLRVTPGLSVVQSGRPGGATSIFLRGVNSNQTLILIDGARVNNPINGVATLANISPDDIERVEIIRGPQSTLYGADALGGVINIITRQGHGKPAGAFSFEGGSHNTFRETANVSGAQKSLDYAFSITHSQIDNVTANDDYENLTASGKLGYTFSDRARISTAFRYVNTEAGVPGTIPPGPDLNERLKDEAIFGRAALDLTVADWWQQSLALAETHEDLRDRGGAFGPETDRSDILQVNWQHNFPTADWHTFTAGIDWYQNSGQFDGSGGQFDKAVNNWAGFIQDQLSLGERLALTGGGRFDSHSQFGDNATYRFAGVLKFPETHTRLKASAGTAFKAPTLIDLYSPLFGNSALKPEKSFGWDAGIEQDLFDGKTSVGARYFENRIENLITFVFVPPFSFTPQNINRARTRGVEVSAEVRPTETLGFRISYTFLETEDLSTGRSLLRRPKHSGNVGADWRCCSRFSLHTDATLVGSRDDIDPVTYVRARNGGYVNWNAAFTADVTPQFQVFGRMENLLDARYEEAKGYPALGWTWYLGVKAQF